MLVIAAALSVPDPRGSGPSRRARRRGSCACTSGSKDAKSDFLSLLNIWKFFVDLREEGGLSGRCRLVARNSLNWLRLRGMA